MSYKQSPFPMIAGTSPAKGLLKEFLKRSVKKGVKVFKSLVNKKRNPTKEYRWNEPQRGARNPDGTRR